MTGTNMIVDWMISKLEELASQPRILVTDALRLLPDTDGSLHRFARKNNFTIIVASTNLVFRDLYEKAISSDDVEKILIIDRAPLRRKQQMSTSKAPPPFYPDILAGIPEDARITIDLRQFLIEKTGDHYWPVEINNPRLARLISSKLDAVLSAHKKLRSIELQRFTDNDLKTIIAYSALGIPQIAFSIPQPEDYWKLGMVGHAAIEELEEIAPEITAPIREGLRNAPAPFCWFAERDPDIVVKVFYLGAILLQHTSQWRLVLKAINNDFTEIDQLEDTTIVEVAPKLINFNPAQVETEVRNIENGFSKQQLQLFLLDGLHLNLPESIPNVLKNEKYSNLVRSAGLLIALEDLLSSAQKIDHNSILEFLESEGKDVLCLADRCHSPVWVDIKRAYQLTTDIINLQRKMADSCKALSVKRNEDLQLDFFLKTWNKDSLNCVEYYISTLERLVWSNELLPADENILPSMFSNSLNGIREKVGKLSARIQDQLTEVNRRFQQLVYRKYTSWMRGEDGVILTNRFFKECVKPHWDPESESAVCFVFDGMRLDIWDELLKPLIEDRFEMINEFTGMALLPTETHVSRKAIFAGLCPDAFDSKSGEDVLLAQTMKREFRISAPVEVIEPNGPQTGETVRYRCSKLDVYIFELCDKELHKIQMKARNDGTWEPSRPLSFVYKQHLKNIIETELMAIIRRLEPRTKVFITADHGFGLIGRERIRVGNDWVNEPSDCNYQNARLSGTLESLHVSGKEKQKIIEFDMNELRLPVAETRFDRRSSQTIDKKFKSIIFPVAGYAFSRPGVPFNPDAFSHGGISIQEMLIPMFVLQVKEPDTGMLNIGNLEGQDEILEGEEVFLTVELNCTNKNNGDIRVEIDGQWGFEDNERLPQQVIYIGKDKKNIDFRFVPDTTRTSKEDRTKGILTCELSVTISYRHDGKLIRRNKSKLFNVRLNSERIIRRVPTHLGAILGLTPKNMR